MAILTRRNNKTPLGIYIHIPFCRSKCQYCDFYSMPCKDDKLMDSYLDAICAHLKEAGALCPGYRVDTVYFGGGTPSYFGADALAIILTAIRRNFDVAIDAEITFEANPDSVTDRLLHRLKAEGFNRVSLGVQCDNDEILKKLGRPHTYAQAVTAYQRIRKAGFRNVSLDLMYGLPGQSLHDWQETLENVLKLNPEHMSCYGLKVEEGTPLYDVKDFVGLADDDTQADMYMPLWRLCATMASDSMKFPISAGRACTPGTIPSIGPAANIWASAPAPARILQGSALPWCGICRPISRASRPAATSWRMSRRSPCGSGLGST